MAKKATVLIKTIAIVPKASKSNFVWLNLDDEPFKTGDNRRKELLIS